MNRPQIINPETKQIIQLFSEDVESLLDQGYTIENVLSYPILPVSKNIPLIGLKELDEEIFLNLETDDLKNVCNINQYTKQICDDKSFWLKKLAFNHLSLPDLKIDNIDWFRLYEAISSTKSNLYMIKVFEDTILYEIKHRFYTSDFTHYLQLIDYDNEVKFKFKKIKSITCYYNETYKCNIRIKSTNYILDMSKDSLNLLIIYMKYDNVIINHEILPSW